MRLRQAELARRLGVSKQAVSDALSAGRLVREADGLIDTEAAENRFYLGRFTAHRGKQRVKAVQSPARASALLARARAAYENQRNAFRDRLRTVVPASIIFDSNLRYLRAAREELSRVPDSVDFHMPTFAAEIERAFNVVLHVANEAARLFPPQTTNNDCGPALPIVLPPDTCLDDARAWLDLLAATRLDLSTALARGEALTKTDASRLWAEIDSLVYNSIARLAQTATAELAPIVRNEGSEVARERLRVLLAPLLARIAAKEAEIDGRYEKAT